MTLAWILAEVVEGQVSGIGSAEEVDLDGGRARFLHNAGSARRGFDQVRRAAHHGLSIRPLLALEEPTRLAHLGDAGVGDDRVDRAVRLDRQLEHSDLVIPQACIAARSNGFPVV